MNLLNWVYGKFLNLISFILLLLLGIYRTIGTMFMGGSCRFTPSCSEYANQALAKCTPWIATKLILKRIIKCHPLGPFGIDPLPDRGLIK